MLSQTRNRLVSLGTAQPTQAGLYADAQNRYVPGYPVDGIWTRGILSYADANGNGILEANEVRYADSATYAGNYAPKRRLGWQNNISTLSGLISIGANFTYSGEALQHNRLLFDMCQSNRCRGAVDSTAPLAMQAAALSTPVTAWSYLEHVSSFRFEELSVTLTAPKSVARMLRTQRASLSLMGRNLKFWSRYRGADPDVNTSASGGDTVTDAGGVPQPRSFTMRVNLGY
jgi:hypothetical protein